MCRLARHIALRNGDRLNVMRRDDRTKPMVGSEPNDPTLMPTREQQDLGCVSSTL